MRVLIVDDDERTVKGIKYHCDDNNWDSRITDFDDCYKEILMFNPDVVILDWCKTPGDDSGMPILQSIWMNGYRPIIIFSGNTDTLNLDEEYKNSNLVRVIPKGEEAPVIDLLDTCKEYYGVLSSFREEMGKTILEAFKAMEAIQKSSDTYLGDEVVQYILTKRAVNYFDLQETGQLIPPWAIYIYPPILKRNLCVCDILRVVEENKNISDCGSSAEYRLVLSPSCDLYKTETRPAKIKEVLSAKGVEKNKFTDQFGDIASETAKADSHRKRAKTALNFGYKDNLVPLPPMGKILPNLIVDMKALETIDLNKIAVDINA